MIRTIVVLFSAFLLASCGDMPASQPIVSDYNGASVKLQMMSYFGEGARNEASDAEATRVCKTGGKHRAEYASSRALPNYMVEHLYLCL